MTVWPRFLRMVILVAVVVGAPCHVPHLAAEQSGPTSIRIRLLADLDDGSLDEFPLLDAALIASGVHTEQGLEYYDQKLAQVCEMLTVDSDMSARQRAQSVFGFLHKWILTGAYQAECTTLDQSLDTGDYNCVSATILFHCLCERAALDPQAMATAEHVYSRYATGSENDVETTFPEWFSQPASARAHLRTSRSGNSGSPRRLDTLQLLGKVYYNLGVTYLEDADFAAAVDALRTSVSLDPEDRCARDNLLAALNNWALMESDVGRYESAADLLDQGRQLDAHYDPFQANDLHIHQKWALSLCRDGKHNEALSLLQRCYERRPDAELYDLGRFAVCSLWAESLLDLGQIESAWNVFHDARQRFPQRAELLRYEEAAIHRSVQALLQQGERGKALTVSAKGVQWQPDSERLKRQYDDLTRSDS